MNTAADIWNKAQEFLLTKLGQETFERCLGDVQAVAYGDGTGLLTLATSSSFMMQWLKNNYSDVLRAAVIAAGAADFDLIARDAASMPEPVAPRPARATRQRPASAVAKAPPPPLNTPWRPDLTFDNFVIGSSNRIPVAAARHVAQDPGKSYNPLFIYGGVGLGKTHLLMAIANEIQAIRSRARVEYLTSEDFVNRYVEALQNKTLPAFRQHFRGLDLLLIDDVQFFEGKVGTSEEFFHTFNSLQNHHKQIVLASDRTPSSNDRARTWHQTNQGAQ